ncbi:MAG: class I SAM-dependent methyltransferase [Candidatus Kapabacteria bacterium]|nr:class I SAM-dependent methyltransferase [Candidatus Kapabacteria bacterium]
MGNFESYWKKKFEESAKFSQNFQMSISSKVAMNELRRVFTIFLEKYWNDKYKTILDIGCGPGNYFDIYQKFNLDITGLDFSPQQLEPVKQKFPDAKLIAGRVEETDFNHKFDVISIIGVIQTVDEPEIFLRRVKDLLNDNGLVLMTYSNRVALYPKIGNARYLYLYSLEEAKIQLKKYFDILEYKRVYYFPSVLNVFRKLFYPIQIPLLNHSFMFVLK